MGIRLSNFMGDVGASLRRSAFKPNSHFTVDPVPTMTGESMKHIPAFKPGHGAPDPVPSMPASKTDIPSFKTPISLDSEGNMSWIEVAPIPSTPGSH